MQSDPCDDWSEALGLYVNPVYGDFDDNRDVYVIDYESYGVDVDSIRGHKIDFMIIDFMTIDEYDVMEPVNLQPKHDVSWFEAMAYDYRKHDRNKAYGKPARNRPRS
jgi:hypothetical protein